MQEREDRKEERGATGSYGSRTYIGPDEEKEKERKARLDREKHKGFTAGKAGAGAGGGADMPKQRAGEDAAAYGARLREWRESRRQKKAMETLPAAKK